MLSDSFGGWVGTGLCEMVYQQSGIISEGIEFGSWEIPFGKRAILIEEDSHCVPGALNRLDGLVITGYKLRWMEFDVTRNLEWPTLNNTPFFAATDT